MSSTGAPTAGDLLRLGTRAPLLLLAVFVVSTAALVFPDLPSDPVPNLLAYLILCAAAAALVVPADPLPMRRTLLIAAAPVVSTVLASLTLPVRTDLGYLTWTLGASSLVMFFLALRGRRLLAWIGLLAMCAATIGWTVLNGLGALMGVELVIRHAGILLIGTLFSIAFDAISARIGALHRVQADRAALDSAARSAIQVRAQQAVQLDDMARQMLTRLAAGETLNDQDRASCLLIEAGLRDSVRARALYRQPLIDAARDARARGVQVTLLDDSGEQDLHEAVGPAASERLTSLVAAELTAATTGSITVRILPTDRPVLATLTTQSASSMRAMGVGRDGRVAES